MLTNQCNEKIILTCDFVVATFLNINLKIAGGSGITPMLQVIDAIVKNPEDNTQVTSLLYLINDLLHRILKYVIYA